MLISFLSGYFNYTFLLLLLIVFHEFGHLLLSSMFGYGNTKVIIYPFGGITESNGLLNSSMIKELIILIGGPLFQEILFLILLVLYKNGFVTETNYNIVYTLHKSLLCFNFLPIIPLDGSKILNLFLERIFSYKKANIILIIISFIMVFVIVIFEKRLIIIFLSIMLIRSIFFEISNHNTKFNKFILERYLYNFSFKKKIIVNNIKGFKRSKSHKIIYNNKIYDEKEYLNKLYKKNSV